MELAELQIPNGIQFKKDIQIEPDNSNLIDIFFDEFFPCVKGHAKIIDEYHSQKDSTYYLTVRNDKIIFHDEEAPDPDWKVKMAYTLMIAAVSEVETG